MSVVPDIFHHKIRKSIFLAKNYEIIKDAIEKREIKVYSTIKITKNLYYFSKKKPFLREEINPSQRVMIMTQRHIYLDICPYSYSVPPESKIVFRIW